MLILYPFSINTARRVSPFPAPKRDFKSSIVFLAGCTVEVGEIVLAPGALSSVQALVTFSSANKVRPNHPIIKIIGREENGRDSSENSHVAGERKAGS